MNGQHSGEQGGQGGQESHLSFLLNAANGQNALMGFGGPGSGVIGGAHGLRYGVAEASLEEQILQRASALRAEALMQQQQQQHQQRQHQLSAALAAFQQQQQFSSLGLNPNIAALMEARGAQEQEALLGRAAALRELGIGGAGGSAGMNAGGMDRLQQLELGRLEELERRRQQLAALANLSGSGRGPSETTQGEPLAQDSGKSEPVPEKEVSRESGPNAEKSKDDLRKKSPGTVIVPCRARGMPMDHNFKVSFVAVCIRDGFDSHSLL